jgi:hypothetical protein
MPDRSSRYAGRMTNAMSIAAAGVNASAVRFAQNVQDIVGASLPGSRTDLATAIVGATTNELAFKADVAVFKMADKMMGTLLDMMA